MFASHPFRPGRRRALTGAAMGLALATLAAPALAQERFPARTITLVVPQAAGGANDAIARVLGQKLSQQLGQSVVIDNRPGAGGNVGTAWAAKTKPDGHTLLVQADSAQVINPWLYKSTGFDPVKDFEPVAPLAGAMLEQQAGIRMVHVPYKGTGPALQDLLAGQVQLTFGTAPPFMPHIAGGKLRVLAVTGKERLASLPHVPTTAEAGYPKLTPTSWFALFAPAAMPQDIAQKLAADVQKVMADPAFKQKALNQGATADYQSPAQLGTKVKADHAEWAKVIQASRIEAD